MNISIRKIPPSVAEKLDELASKSNLSREAYLRKYLTSISLMSDIQECEDKYANLVKTLLEVVERNTLEMERIRLILENIDL